MEKRKRYVKSFLMYCILNYCECKVKELGKKAKKEYFTRVTEVRKLCEKLLKTRNETSKAITIIRNRWAKVDDFKNT